MAPEILSNVGYDVSVDWWAGLVQALPVTIALSSNVPAYVAVASDVRPKCGTRRAPSGTRG